MLISSHQFSQLGQNKLNGRNSYLTFRHVSSLLASSRSARLNTTRCQPVNTFNDRFDLNTQHVISRSKISLSCCSVNSRCFSTSTQVANVQSQTDQTVSTSETKGQNVSTETNTPQAHRTSNKLQGRNILITGGTSGIGFAIVKRALLEGASHVRVITRDSDRGQKAIDRLRTELTFEFNIDIVQAEVKEYGEAKLFSPPTNTNSPERSFNTLIHSAGISQTSLLPSTDPSQISQILHVNLESAALLSKQFLKRFTYHSRAYRRQQQQSLTTSPDSQTNPPNKSPQPPPLLSWTVTNISSLLASKSGVGSSIYAASKAGLIALTRTAALEGAEIRKQYACSDVDPSDGVHEHTEKAPGFRANVVVPGYIDTPMTKNFSNTTKERLCRQIPSDRFGTPDEVADAVVFLLGNEYANNCVLGLDGGLSGV